MSDQKGPPGYIPLTIHELTGGNSGGRSGGRRAEGDGGRGSRNGGGHSHSGGHSGGGHSGGGHSNGGGRNGPSNGRGRNNNKKPRRNGPPPRHMRGEANGNEGQYDLGADAEEREAPGARQDGGPDDGDFPADDE